MKLNILKSITLDVRGESWRFHLLSDRAYTKRFKAGSEALCDLELKEVWFKKTHFGHGVIAHELMHILFDQASVSSSSLDAYQVEELACEIIARSFLEIPYIVSQIHHTLR